MIGTMKLEIDHLLPAGMKFLHGWQQPLRR
jgi:hypothetical protein